MKPQHAVLLALLAGCSSPAEVVGCIDEGPASLERPCSGDGECGDWLVCEDARCKLPAAVSGAGGERLLVGDSELRVEVARSDLARSRGLGHRPCIEDGWGLLIEFPEVGEHEITTETMRFDIDIAMAGEDGVVHTVHRDAPAGGKVLYAGAESTFWVLETPAGVVEVANSTRLRLPPLN